MKRAKQSFGGGWTEKKLESVRQYLIGYRTALKNTPFKTAYIDAFAGTGYRTTLANNEPESLLFPEMDSFLDGSARIALQVEPRFHKYIFIEKDPNRFAELQKLKEEFPHLAEDIKLENKDANSFLKGLCQGPSWKNHRAVLFLDPFGMQVTWDTIEAIGQTQAIDLWLLFPLGVAVNRILTKSGRISPTWRNKLDEMFGASDWYDVFYRKSKTQNLFGEEEVTEKIGDFDSISQYFVNRLNTVFAGVAPNPLPLYNSRKNPIFVLCFAVGNPKGKYPALRIARHILEK
ncbi:MAG TPA: three-Cys-motif partner protein TcmP [Blastocatellia bacterium]